jgi:general secretion pathway protein B
MSILLEALRKTEKNQQQQQVPTIHNDGQGQSGPEALKTGPLVAMIAVALFVSGWVTWRQYQLPEGLYQPPVTLSPDQPRSAGAQVRAEDSPVEKPQAVTGSKPATAPANPPTANTAPGQPRTPVETYQAPAASEPAPASAQTGTSLNRGFGSGPVDTSNSSSSRPANQQSAGGRSQPGTPAPGLDSETATAVEGDKAHIPEPIGYWELPDAIRAEVPEIRYSVLVYNTDPAQRFVLVDGQRLGEGDSIKAGLLVEEIRRDGVIFSYRLYKFIVRR